MILQAAQDIKVPEIQNFDNTAKIEKVKTIPEVSIKQKITTTEKRALRTDHEKACLAYFTELSIGGILLLRDLF